MTVRLIASGSGPIDPALRRLDLRALCCNALQMISAQQKFWNAYAQFAQKPVLAMTTHVPTARRVFDASAVLNYKTPAGLRLTPQTLHHDGARAKITICQTGQQPTGGTMLYLHGGGFVMGSLRSHRHLVAALGAAANQTGCFLHYGLSPENPFPAALDTATTAYLALCAQPDAGPVSIVGDSAGGNLAFALLHRICTTGLPKPVAVAAMSPAADLRDKDPQTIRDAAIDKLLPRNWMRQSQQAYLSGRDPANPEISPVLGDFTGAPPCLIHADETEALFPDCAALAARLRAAGVDTTFVATRNRTHVWHLNVARCPEADASVKEIGTFISTRAAIVRA